MRRYELDTSCLLYTSRYKLEECGKSVEELVTAGIVNAKKARDTVKPDGLVALDVGPIGQLLEPTGVLSFEEAYDMYAEIVKAGAAAGADLVVFETCLLYTSLPGTSSFDCIAVMTRLVPRFPASWTILYMNTMMIPATGSPNSKNGYSTRRLPT